jgi:hypothetical protein
MFSVQYSRKNVIIFTEISLVILTYVCVCSSECGNLIVWSPETPTFRFYFKTLLKDPNLLRVPMEVPRPTQIKFIRTIIAKAEVVDPLQASLRKWQFWVIQPYKLINIIGEDPDNIDLFVFLDRPIPGRALGRGKRIFGLREVALPPTCCFLELIVTTYVELPFHFYGNGY